MCTFSFACWHPIPEVHTHNPFSLWQVCIYIKMLLWQLFTDNWISSMILAVVILTLFWLRLRESWAWMMKCKEIGYGCTISESRCRSILSVFSPLDELTLSRIVSTVVQTHATLGYSQNVYSIFPTGKESDSVPASSGLNSWNIDVLVASINQIVSIKLDFFCIILRTLIKLVIHYWLSD